MTSTSTSILKILLISVLVIGGLYYAKDFLMPLFIGGVLATLFLPFCKWMESKKISRGVAVSFCLFVLILAFTFIGSLIVWQVNELTNDFPLIKQKAIETGNHIQEYIFNNLGISAQKQSQLLKDQQSSFTGMIPEVAGSVANIAGNFFLMLVYIFGLLYYRIHIKQFLVRLSPLPKRQEMEQIVFKVTEVSQQYLLGLTKMIVLLWIMYGIGFAIVGVKNPLFFAILCGLLEIVPFIGNITGTTLTVFVSAVQGADFSMLTGIVITYGLVQFIQGWLLEPLIVGRQVKINPFATIIALVLGEMIWGIPGIILAIPITAMIKIICDHIDSLKPYGFLIGEIESKKSESGLMKWIKSWFRLKQKKVG